MPRLDVSRRFLKDARICLDSGGYRSCASRAYYAVYHACIALFKFFGYQPDNFRGRDRLPARRWEHKIVTVNFHIEFTQKRKLFHWKIGRQLRSLYDTRIRGDYRTEVNIPVQLARERLIVAEAVVNRIAEVMEP